jgi:hypothetical protein
MFGNGVGTGTVITTLTIATIQRDNRMDYEKLFVVVAI